MKKQPIQAGKRKPPPHISVEFIFVIFHCFLKGCVWEIFVNVVVHTLHYLLVVQGGGYSSEKLSEEGVDFKPIWF